MAQSTVPSTSSSQPVYPLPDVFSAAVTELFAQVRPGIVQVRNEQRGGGTGIIWQNDGRIITNHHVVPDNHDTIQVHLTDGRTLPAQVIDRNPELDLALLKVQGDNLQALEIGDSESLRVGEWVFAIGHPWGQRWTLTRGIVSAINTVKINRNESTQYIKSDVALAPGNSGGPLLNADGQVVGVNAMIFGGDLSVSIPGNAVSSWLASLSGKHAGLGVSIQSVELPAELRQQTQPDRASGLMVIDTQERQAHVQDLLPGDIILDINAQPVETPAALRAYLNQQDVTAKVQLTIVRGGTHTILEVPLIQVS